jgi:tetratricopeptide (TPR) repeat protein
MTSFFENDQSPDSGNEFLKNQLFKNYKNTVLQFVKITKNLSKLKLAFALIFLIEVFLSGFLILNFYYSSIIAFSLGIIVLTIFSYFVLHFYFQAKKPEQMEELQKRFIATCRHAISVPMGLSEHHLSVAGALMKLSYYLYGIEYGYFSSSLKSDYLKKFLEKLSSILHREDVFKMQESLLFSSIEEHLIQIKNTPTDLELHVSLASSFVSLAKLYKEAIANNSLCRYLKSRRDEFRKKFEISSKLAIDEFTILKEYAPNDPWIHAQLAQCYHTLGMYEDEAKEYETMVEISPNDFEIKFRLARINFTLGKNAQGLCLYEELKNEGYKRADELLSLYASTRAVENIGEPF